MFDVLCTALPKLHGQHSSQKYNDLRSVRTPNCDAIAVTKETSQPQAQNGHYLDIFSNRQTVDPPVDQDMLLLHQTGSVKVGEVVRYTLTYTPSLDRILPPPQNLHIKVKNTSAIPLRAAYLHGPYTLYTSAYPSTFDPNVKHERVKEEGAPAYEPQLKAGGSWTAQLTVPEEVRVGAEDSSRGRNSERQSFTWIIEIASQILFSATATVHYELLVGRDEKSVALGITGVVSVGQGQGVPGKLEELQTRRSELKAEVQTRGVFSKAIRLAVDDTETLWNTPQFPSWDEKGNVDVKQGPEHGDKRDTEGKKDKKQKKQKRIHLVIITHGLHSNLGADMLYMKETIDSASKQAKEDAKQRKADLRAKQAQEDHEFGRDAANLRSRSVPEVVIAPTPVSEEDEEDEEQVIVRGFNGNACKTEKGIQYLGKRLAKYVLSMTYPDQPFLPVKSSLSKTITRSLTGQKSGDADSMKPIHKNSTIVRDEKHTDRHQAYRITSISFIGHSLGGLVQTYAVAYIHKHSPEFFSRINPVNFIALASPFLGLSNENPMYVKFALDFGLVGRTGQDLGLTWRAPAIAKSGWGAMVNGLVNDPHKEHQPDPGSKPLLRILPTGPAHQALKRFRNRTVYSNVVNDGIVPLRTSCLLFLDWRGLGRVEKARRENGLIGTMVNWGWNEMTGQNASAARKPIAWNDLVSDDADDMSKASDDPGSAVPDARASQFIDVERKDSSSDDDSFARQKGKTTNFNTAKEDAKQQESNIWAGLMSWFRPQAASKPVDAQSTSSKSSNRPKRKKTPKIYKRGQVVGSDSEPSSPDKPSTRENVFDKPHGPVRGSSLYTMNSAEDNMEAPPKTTVFESAGDLLNPPLPPPEFLLDPAARPRTIFHDRVYHPEDIPSPPAKRQKTFMGFNSGSRRGSRDHTVPNQAHSDLDKISSSKTESANIGVMKIEEKIARAYHKDMAWRKVLISMEPDAHNNMIVRRMFANAYGWPVVKHMCDTHFAFTASAQTRDDDEDTNERAKPANEVVGSTGEQVEGQVDPPKDEQIEPRKHNEKEPRSKSADHAPAHLPRPSINNLSPEDPKESLRSLSSRIRSRETAADSSSDLSRTASEVRESRDEVSDLVSVMPVTAMGTPSGSYSSATHSGTAALNRLARQDSARWSDRFFDGSENDSDDDEAYFEELRRARERGEIPYDEEGDGTNTDHNARSTTSAESKPGAVRDDNQPGRLKVLTDYHRVTTEPETMSLASRTSTREEVDSQTLGLTGIGLGKAASQQVFDPADKQETVTEQVAHAAGAQDNSNSNAASKRVQRQ